MITISYDPLSYDPLVRLGLQALPQLEKCLSLSRLALDGAAYRQLPPPVRFRASGALRAWLEFLHLDAPTTSPTVPEFAEIGQGLVDPTMSVNLAMLPLHLMVRPIINAGLASAESQERAKNTLCYAAEMLAFWLRRGAVYEPTLALGTLLNGSDFSHDIPMDLVRLPHPAMCIMPPWQHRHHCANASALLIFEHRVIHSPNPAERSLSIFAYWQEAKQYLRVSLILAASGEQASLAQTIQSAYENSRAEAQATSLRELQIYEECAAKIRSVVDYTVKMLLYLRLDNAAVRTVQPFSSAPRNFSGLGRRKRELKLAEIDRLYDRCIVGPPSLGEYGLNERSVPLDAAHSREASPHWRRGHFRHQAHGPQASLRKLMFIAPTLVRADKLPTNE